MRYFSTRGQTEPVAFQDAVLMGLASDGGLLIPESIPQVGEKLDAWAGLSFPDLAFEVLSPYVGDIPEVDLRRLINAAYATFDSTAVVPLHPLKDLYVQELWHGPTLAFKDVALQLLGQLFEYILEARGEHLNILGATSGDTGSAAIAGARGRNNIDIFIMFPEGKTSPIQELQMTTVADQNVHALAIDGTFDDCQAILKSIFRDLPFKARWHLGAVNSVNWARVLAQVVYYFHAYYAAGQKPLAFSVPTGNFGDIFAGWLAAKMGLPITQLILATNENDILSVFFNTGRYARGDVKFTISPSMDIQVASNFERFLFYRLGENAEALRGAMESFAHSGAFHLDDGAPIDDLICAQAVGRAETLATITAVHEEEGYLLDPHTAVGVAAGRTLRKGDEPLVCLATAHPSKFPEAVNGAVGASLATHPRVEGLAGLPKRSTPLPASEDAVKAFIEAHGRR